MQNTASPEFIAKIALQRWRAAHAIEGREKTALEGLVVAYAGVYDFDQEHVEMAQAEALRQAWELLEREA